MKEYSYGVVIYRIRDYSTDLLFMRAKGHNQWGMLKGKIETDETIQECATREVLEESGILINPLFLEDYFENNTKRKLVGIFLIQDIHCDLSNVRLCEREVDELRWFNVNDYVDIQLNQKRIYNEIVNKFINREYYFSNKDTN